MNIIINETKTSVTYPSHQHLVREYTKSPPVNGSIIRLVANDLVDNYNNYVEYGHSVSDQCVTLCSPQEQTHPYTPHTHRHTQIHTHTDTHTHTRCVTIYSPLEQYNQEFHRRSWSYFLPLSPPYTNQNQQSLYDHLHPTWHYPTSDHDRLSLLSASILVQAQSPHSKTCRQTVKLIPCEQSYIRLRTTKLLITGSMNNCEHRMWQYWEKNGMHYNCLTKTYQSTLTTYAQMCTHVSTYTHTHTHTHTHTSFLLQSHPIIKHHTHTLSLSYTLHSTRTMLTWFGFLGTSPIPEYETSGHLHWCIPWQRKDAHWFESKSAVQWEMEVSPVMPTPCVRSEYTPHRLLVQWDLSSNSW